MRTPGRNDLDRLVTLGVSPFVVACVLALGSSIAGAQQGMGLYKDGQLVEQIAVPLNFVDPAQAARAAAGDPAAQAAVRLNDRIAQVRGSEPSPFAVARNAAALRAAAAEASLRTCLADLKARGGDGATIARLRAISTELAAARAGLQEVLNQAKSRVLQLRLDPAIALRQDGLASTIEQNYQNLSRAVGRVLAGEAGSLDDAIAIANALAPPVTASPAGRPPTVQMHMERAPRMTREQADALLVRAVSSSTAPARAAAPADAAAPSLPPPTAASLPTPADLTPTVEIQLTPEIVSKAAALGNSPLAIYEFVRNSVRFQPYLGSRKGAVETLRQLHGNDTDQASLLMALLRAAGIPCRYVRGTVEMTPERAMSWVGVDDAQTAGSILTTAGMDGISIVSGPGVVAIRCTRVWVEAYLPYSNYRGLPLDATGKTWVPMDPAFALSTITPGQDVLTPMGFNTDVFLADYISTFHALSPIEKFVADIQTYLNTAQPGVTVAQVERTAATTAQNLGLLPASLPYEVRAITGRFSELEDNKRYKVRFRLYNGGTTFIDHTLNVSQLAGHQLTIDYIGATPADQATIDSHGGIYETPPNLVNVKPRLKLDSAVLVTSTNFIGMGRTHSSDMHFTQPTGASNSQPLVQNTIIAGNSQAIAFDTYTDQRDAFLSDTGSSGILESLLSKTASDYLSRVDRGAEQVEKLMRVVTTQDVSEAIVESSVSVAFSFGVPITFEWTGLIVDADRRIVGPFAVNGDDSKSVPYMLLSGYDGSVMENRIFEDTYAQQAISTIKILELSRDSGIPVFRIVTSIAADAPGLSQPASVVSAINAALAQGHHVIIPRTGITVGLWSGTGYIDLNPATGAAGYIISGGISSGVSTNGGATVQTWPISITCKLKNITGTVTNPAADTPDLSAIFVPDNAPFTFQITYTIICDDGSPGGVPQAPLSVPLTTTKTKQQILDAFGPGDYTLSIPGYPDFQKRTFTLMKIEVEIYKPAIIDPAQPMIPKDDRATVGSMTFVNLDNDDKDANFDDTDTAVAGGDNELLKYKVKIQPKTLGAGTVKVTASSGAASVKVWKQNDKATANAYNLGDALAVPTDLVVEGDFLIRELWVEGIAPHTAPRGSVIQAEYAAGPRTTNDKAALTIVGIDKIEWEGKNNSASDNNTLDADPNWPSGLVPAALRVFPDARVEGIFFPGPGSARDKVTVKVTLSVAPIEPVNFHFRSFDVDDPTANQAPLDDDTGGGTDEDNFGTSPAKAGKIAGSDGTGLLTVSFDTASKTFEFQTTMQPGDNFRIAGNADKTFVSGLLNDERTAGAANVDKQRITDPNVTGTAAQREIREAAKYASDVLTVWRNLHIELDSMGVVAGNFSDGNITSLNTGSSATAVRVTVDVAADASPNASTVPAGNGRFEKGTLRIAGTHNISPLDSNGANDFRRAAGINVCATPLPFEAEDNDVLFNSTMAGTITAITGGSLTLQLNITSHSETPIDWPDFVGGRVRIAGGPWMPIGSVNAAATQVTVTSLSIPYRATDDDVISGDVPQPDTAGIAPIYATAYVRPLFDTGKDTPDATFVLNSNDADAAAQITAAKGTSKAINEFWVVSILNGYQTGADRDNDPDNEGTDRGVSHLTLHGVIMLTESIRDWIATPSASGGGNGVDPAGGGRQTRYREILNHEIGHQFGQVHPDGAVTAQDPNGGVEAPSCCPPDSPASGTRGASTFTQIGLKKIRQSAHPGL